MSMHVLTAVFEEVRRLSIAGSTVAAGDSRLKAILPQLEHSAKRAPVFAKIAESIRTLIASKPKAKSEALLELSILLNAVLHTQGESGIDGRLEPIQTREVCHVQSESSAHVLKKVSEALLNRQKLREDDFFAAYDRGDFDDIRMIEPAIAGLRHPNTVFGKFLENEVLPGYGRAIIPSLREQFNEKGQLQDLMIFRLLTFLDARGSRDILLSALENGSIYIREAAVERLGDSDADIALLKLAAKSKARSVREAALQSLSDSGLPEAITELSSIIQNPKVLEDYSRVIETNQQSEVLDCLIQEIRKQFSEAFDGRSRSKAELDRPVEALLGLLDCLASRDDRNDHRVEALLLEYFSQRNRIVGIKSQTSAAFVVGKLIDLMVECTRRTQRALVDAHESLDEYGVASALEAALLSRIHHEVYELFSGYLIRGVQARRNSVLLRKAEEVEEVLRFGLEKAFPCLNSHQQRIDALDPRWLDLAVELELDDLVVHLARKGHIGSHQVLTRLFEEYKKINLWREFHSVLDTMVFVRHPDVVEAMGIAIEFCYQREKYGDDDDLDQIGELIPVLPSRAIPHLEAVFAKLPSPPVDALVNGLNRLKEQLA